MKLALSIFWAIISFTPSIVFSQQVYKCSEADGSITFSDKPCGDNAQKMFIENNQSGISTNQSYSKPISERYYRNLRKKNSESQKITRAQNEAQREYDQMIKAGYNSRAATRAASVVMNSATNPDGSKAKREFDRVMKKTSNSAAAERAANVVLGRPGAPSAVEPLPNAAWEPNLTSRELSTTSPILLYRFQILGGEFYIPTSPSGEQYIKPGGGICNRQGPNLNCDGIVKPASGVVTEPHNN